METMTIQHYHDIFLPFFILVLSWVCHPCSEPLEHFVYLGIDFNLIMIETYSYISK